MIKLLTQPKNLFTFVFIVKYIRQKSCTSVQASVNWKNLLNKSFNC